MAQLIRQYWFWLAAVSLVVMGLERIAPWRREQEWLRPQFGQDLFWLTFNGVAWGFVVSGLLSAAPWWHGPSLKAALDLFTARFSTVSTWPFAAQVVTYLVLADFTEWCVHNGLHRLDWLWPIHRLHHSIHTMDWIGNFRFHWGELVVYGLAKYLPLTLLGARYEPMLVSWVISTTVGHLNHSNLNISWGPLRYVLNSPRMHIWHHDKHPDNRVGYNFAVVFSLWDWLFGTAHMPDTQPAALGFGGDDRYPDGVVRRFFLPYVREAKKQVRIEK